SHYARGDEIGYFQHGSTIIVFATADYRFCENTATGARIQMGQALLTLSADKTSTIPMPPQEQQP
ncbi:MAG TPA: phosphatidylserine decarboxylase, partial [Kineobactrum sp.]